MRDERRRATFGYLVCGMIIGLSLGVIITKQDHNVLWMIVGPILGTIAGAGLESLAQRQW